MNTIQASSREAVYLSVSFALAVLNESHRLPGVIASIRAQQGFSGRVEIVIADGGSTDGTRECALAAECVVVENPLRRCEPGIALAMARCTGDIIVVMAADNPLVGDDFLRNIVKPFSDQSIAAAFPLVVSTKEDSTTNRYLNHFTDPLNHFVYWNAASPATFARAYHPLDRNADYVVYDYRPENPPLLALAQGFAVRKGFERPTGSEEDDIAPIDALVERGSRIAFVSSAKIAHHTVKGYDDFIKKFEPRIAARLRSSDMPVWHRHRREAFGRRLRRIVWPVYATSFVVPLGVAIYGAFRDRNREWFMHPLLSFGLALAFWRQLSLCIVERLGTRYGTTQ